MDQGTHHSHYGTERTGNTFIVGVNEKGRMTLPARVRQLLQLPAEPAMVELSVEPDGRIAIQGRILTVAETAGSVAPLASPMEWKEVEAIVREEVAEHYQTGSTA